MSWPPHITVACIIEKDHKFLMVEELHNGMLVFNQPAGHLEPDETLQEAAIRETYEETGWHVEPVSVLGVSRYISPQSGVIYYRTTFIAKPVSLDHTAALDEGIVNALWLSYEELKSQPEKLRSPLVIKNIEQYLAGQQFPLSVIDDAC
jgi:8-oxo-dGTP pyrophosphatase MutT (NUDIX family)